MHKCECGESYIDTEVNALGHDFGDYVSDNNATYTSDGTKTATCDRDDCEGKDVINNPSDPAKAISVFTYSGNEITGLTTYGKTLTELVIPARINDIEFTKIGESAFSYCSSLQSIEIPASVTSIVGSAFSSCSNLATVYYGGTARDWGNISIGNYNNNLTRATRYYYIENESNLPTDGGNYWHYVDGVPTVWVNN